MGGNALNGLVEKYNPPCTILYINTNAQALEHSLVRYKLLIGETVCRGLGTGRNVTRGKEAAAKSLPEIRTYLDYADTICLVAGLGGGTGSGGIQVIAKYAEDLGKKVVCIVSTPFKFEGKDADLVAQEAMRELDHIGVQKIVLNNQDLFTVAECTPTFADAFKAADEAICQKIMRLMNDTDIDDTPLMLEATVRAKGVAKNDDVPALTHAELEEIALSRLASLGMKPETLAEVKKNMLDGDPYGLLYGKTPSHEPPQNLSGEIEKKPSVIKSAGFVLIMAYILFGTGYSTWFYYKQYGLLSTLANAGGLMEYPFRPLIWPVLAINSSHDAKNIRVQEKSKSKFDELIADGHDIDNEHDANIIIGLADNGDADAEFFMANLMMKNNEPEKAIFMTKMAAEHGHPLAQHNLATAYEDGIGGLEKNTKLSRYWYEKAALNGFPPSMNNLANYYHDGEAVEKDMVTAYAWLEMALICFPYYAQSSEMMTPQFKEMIIHNKQAIFNKLSKDEKNRAKNIINELKTKVVVAKGY